jgi:hypothetical protein
LTAVKISRNLGESISQRVPARDSDGSAGQVVKAYRYRRTADIMTDINSQHPFWAAHHLRGVCQHSCLACEVVSWTGNDTMIFGATIRH